MSGYIGKGTPVAVEDGSVEIDDLSATGTPSSTTFLRGDNSWAVVDAVTPTSVSDQNNTSTGSFDVPAGTTAQRPSAANSNTGMIRFNTTIGNLEQYMAAGWTSIAPAPTIIGLSYPGSFTAASPSGGETINITGSNFSTTLNSLTLGGVAIGSYSVVSSSSITFTSPAKSVGDYDIVVTNITGLSSSVSISYSDTPNWVNAIDTVLVTASQGVAVNITSNTAAEGADTIAYSEVTSVLTGASAGELNLTLNVSTGAITGTLPSVTTNTNYTFTLRATDDENQTSDRQFKIVVVANYFGSGSDGSLST